jgi:spermidine dehydrogenase
VLMEVDSFGGNMAGERCWTDQSLGMDCPINRRDFLNGVAIAVGSIGTGLKGAGPVAMQAREGWPQDQKGYYPPLLNGLRGSHPGSFEKAHALRDGDFWKNRQTIVETGERYDLVVVGGGISGLSAAHFYRVGRPDAKILILDNPRRLRRPREAQRIPFRWEAAPAQRRHVGDR